LIQDKDGYPKLNHIKRKFWWWWIMKKI